MPYDYDRTYVDCSCMSHALKVEYDEDWGTVVSFWYRGDGNWVGLRRRLTQAWNLLRHGGISAHDVHLENHQLRDFAEYLTYLADKADSHTSHKEVE